jgi:hypothetical protein
MAPKNTGYSGFDYGVVIGPDGEKTDQISCFPSNVSRCIVIREPKKGLASVGGFMSPSATRTTSYHDSSLVEATERINKVLDDVMKAQKSDSKSLLLLLSDAGPMLAFIDMQVIDDDGR